VSFLGWTFLFGAAAVIGPIVAHMLAKPRFRRVPFTMLQFMRTGRHESHSRRNIRDLLVLLLRCAIIVLIAVLFARPMLKVEAAPPPHQSVHFLALDDSASMAYTEGRSSLLARMVEKAIDRVRAAPEGAVFSVCGLASGRSAQGLSRSETIAEIKRLTVVPKCARPVDFLRLLRQGASPGDTVSAVVLSDFTPGVLAGFEQIRAPAAVDSLSHEIIAPASPARNVAIVDARAVDVVEGKLNVDVVAANYGGLAENRRLVARCEDLRPVVVDVMMSPGERRVLRVRMDVGPRMRRGTSLCLPIELRLEPEDGLPADDTYRLGVYIPQTGSTKVLLVHRADEAFLFETAIEALAGQGAAAGLSLRKAAEERLRAEDLAWADVIVFSSLPTDAACPTGLLKNCLARGGRLVFFATEPGSPQVVERLVREGLIPAAPQKWTQGVAFPEPQPGGGTLFSEPTAKSLANYRFDKIALKGHWLCRVAPEAQCAWRLTNGAAFVYVQAQNAGSSVLVNTSIDDSRGLLAKSGAWVAFCRFLVGEGDRIRQFCFRVDDRPVLNVPDAMRIAGRASIDVENCDGGRTRAAVEGARMVLPVPQSTGWMRTLSEPALHAGINLPEGETDLRRAPADAVAIAMKRAFVTDRDRAQSIASVGPPRRDRPIWKAIAWVTILLLLVEPAITNRLKR
jgi:hypothetical protein